MTAMPCIGIGNTASSLPDISLKSVSGALMCQPFTVSSILFLDIEYGYLLDTGQVLSYGDQLSRFIYAVNQYPPQAVYLFFFCIIFWCHLDQRTLQFYFHGSSLRNYCLNSLSYSYFDILLFPSLKTYKLSSR